MKLLAPGLGALTLLLALPVPAGNVPHAAPPARGDAYVLARDHRTTMSGSLEEATILRDRYPRPFLWFRRDGREYLVRDPKIVEEASELFAPLQELESDHQAVADREESLDREEEALDREQDGLDAAADADADVEEAADDADTAKLQAELDRQRDFLSGRRAELAQRQREVAKQEEALDVEEERLEKAAEASLWKLIDRTIRDGTATPSP